MSGLVQVDVQEGSESGAIFAWNPGCLVSWITVSANLVTAAGKLTSNLGLAPTLGASKADFLSWKYQIRALSNSSITSRPVLKLSDSSSEAVVLNPTISKSWTHEPD